MLTLDLKEIFKISDRFVGSYELKPEDLKLPAEIGIIKEPVKVNLEITKDREGYKIKISLEGNVELECSRCLETYEKDLTQEKTKLLQNTPQEEGVFMLRPKDLEVSFLEEPDIVDVAQLVREEIILSIPMKPLCSPDCRGIPEYEIEFEEKTKPQRKNNSFAILKDLLAGKGGK
ncbi:YceD family protein [Aquifex sp.]